LGLVFTRRIADPEFGARLSGKVGRWNVGVLASDDRAPGKQVPVGSSLHGARTLVGAVRVQRELLNDSSLGILATDRHFGSSDSRVYSADTKIRLSPALYLKGQVAHSDDLSYAENLDLLKNSGRAYLGGLSYTGRNFSYDASYRDFTPGFRVPLGSVQRVDARNASQYAGYYFWPRASKLQFHGPSVSVDMNWDRAGRLQDRYSSIDYRIDFAGPAGLTLSRYDAYESYLSEEFQYGTTSGSFYVNWIKAFNFYGNFGIGTAVNYTTPAGVAPFVGNVQNSSVGFTWRPSKQIRFEEFYYYGNLQAPKEITKSENPAAVFKNHIMRTKVNFQFTRALSIRGILDHNFLSPNTALFDSDHYKSLNGDVLLTYLLNPGTALHIGYNDRFENLEVDPDNHLALRRFGPPAYRTSNQIFAKMSYLFRF
jgi:hypothetical protein